MESKPEKFYLSGEASPSNRKDEIPGGESGKSESEDNGNPARRDPDAERTAQDPVASEEERLRLSRIEALKKSLGIGE